MNTMDVMYGALDVFHGLFSSGDVAHGAAEAVKMARSDWTEEETEYFFIVVKEEK